MNANPTNLSAAELKRNLDAAIAKEHAATATLLWYLGEYESRELHLRDGYASIYKFLTEAHGYSEPAAARRAVAARFARQYPEALSMLAKGDLSLTVLGMVARAEIKSESVADVLRLMKGLSKAQAELTLLDLQAKPAAPKKEKVRPVIIVPPPEKAAASSSPSTQEPQPTAESSQREPQDYVSDVFATPAPASTPSPGSKSLHAFDVSLRISSETMEKLTRAQELLGTKDLASTIDALAGFYNQKKDPLFEGAAKKSEKSKITPLAEAVKSEEKEASKPSRYIAKAVKREVYRNAEGQCTYVNSETGHRCTERRRLEYDHIKPFAAGGTNTAGNLRIYCARHNQLWAKDVFGRESVERHARSG